MPFIETATGARLHIIDQGRGTPIVLLPGLMGTAEAHFTPLLDWLAPHMRVIGVTLRGFGQSTPHPRTFPPDFYDRDARDVLALLDALAIDRAHIFGYSDGGEAALCAATLQPERFLSAATVGSVGCIGPEMFTTAERILPADWITDEEVARNAIADRTAFATEWLAGFQAMARVNGPAWARAERLTCPLLLMLGDEDRLNPAEYARAFAARAADGRVVTFPGLGHGVHEQDWDGFRALYGAFLGIA
jgi:valacyclovir hydrolase